MALPQQPPSKQPRSRPVSRTVGRSLTLPALAVGLGVLLIHNSLASPADPKPPTPSTAVARPTAVPQPMADFPLPAVHPPATVPPLTAVSPLPAVSPFPALSPFLTVAPTAPGPNATASPAPQPLPRSEPERIEIPQIGVDAPFMQLSLGDSGQLNPPPASDTNLVGWFKDGASPGERGASIVVGHVDTQTGPAVFVLLRTLKPGNKVDITRADGTVADFKVDSVETFSKDDFPDDRVYADTSAPELRLITCGGNYDHSAHDYEANVVVFAHLDSVRHS